MPSGHCNTAGDVDEGKINSKTPTEQLHRNCQHVSKTPFGWVVCDCPCHPSWTTPEVKEERQPVVKSVRRTPSGRRSQAEINSWGATLASKKTITVPAPDDPKQVASTRTALYNAAKKQALHVKVSVKDGKITATVKE